jgi:hypothetical protein
VWDCSVAVRSAGRGRAKRTETVKCPKRRPIRADAEDRAGSKGPGSNIPAVFRHPVKGVANQKQIAQRGGTISLTTKSYTGP